MAALVPVMWTVWGALVLALVSLKLYTMRLTRDEDDQVILDSSFDHVKDAQAAIMAKVNKIAPLERTTLWLVAAMTVLVISYYVVDMINQFK